MQIRPGLAFREVNIPICHLNQPVTSSAIGFVLRLLSEGLRAPQKLRLIRHVNLPPRLLAKDQAMLPRLGSELLRFE
jgi:hypothetical protein